MPIVRVYTPVFRVELCRACFDAFALRMGELPYEPRPIAEGIERVVRELVDTVFPAESGAGLRGACQEVC